jgi:hypothetical protein
MPLMCFYIPFYGIQESEKQKDMLIYSYGHDLYLKDLTGTPVKGEVFIYNMIRQEILHKPVSDVSLNKFTLNLPTGYYVVQVITRDKVINGKVYLD